MLLDCADDGGIGGIGEQAKRVPEAEGGLQRAGVGVQSHDVAAHAHEYRGG